MIEFRRTKVEVIERELDIVDEPWFEGTVYVMYVVDDPMIRY